MSALTPCLIVLLFVSLALMSCAGHGPATTASGPAVAQTPQDLSPLKPHLKKTLQWDFPSVDAKFPVNIYYADETTGSQARPVILYIRNQAWPRIGMEDDLSILSDYIERRYIVLTLDFGYEPKATSPRIDEDIQMLYRACFGYRTPSILRAIDLEPQPVRCYIMPQGYRVADNLTYWEIDKHGTHGTLEYIMKTYNEVIVPKVEGRKPAEKPSDMITRDGKPLDYRIQMDIIYPSQAKTKVPVFVFSETQGSRNTHHRYMFQLRGYAYVVMGHCFNPIVPHYWHNRYFELDHWNGLACYTAAIRYLNKFADQYALDTDHIGMMGISKGQYAVTRLLAPNHVVGKESKRFEGFEVGSPQPQPWPGYPSHIHAGWQGMGMGLWETEYLTLNYAPTILAVGENDRDVITQDGTPGMLRAMEKLDINHVYLPMEGLGHSISIGYDQKLGVDRYHLVIDFFDRYLRVDDKLPPVVLIAAPRNGAADVSPDAQIWVQFAPVIDEGTIVDGKGITVTDLGDNRQIKGTWRVSHGGTKFTFDPSQSLKRATQYQVSVSRAVKDKAGTALAAVRTYRFTTAK